MPREKVSEKQVLTESCAADRSRGARDGNVLRCVCGSLLARFVEGKVELKCRRCRRTVMVPIEREGGGGFD
jgi:hypothetical protein